MLLMNGVKKQNKTKKPSPDQVIQQQTTCWSESRVLLCGLMQIWFCVLSGKKLPKSQNVWP